MRAKTETRDRRNFRIKKNSRKIIVLLLALCLGLIASSQSNDSIFNSIPARMY